MQSLKTRTVTVADVDVAAKQQKPAAEIWTISPVVAEHILGVYNTLNRNKKTTNIKNLARAMRDGDWRLTMDSLKFGDDAAFKDGQNRLTACTKAQVAFTTLVVFGVPAEAFDAMDTGIQRGAKDIFKLGGVSNYGPMASAAQWMSFLSDGAPLSDRATRTPQVLLERFHSEWPGLELSLTKDVKLVAKQGHPIGVLVAMHYLFAKSDGHKADAFFQTWATGINHMAVQRNPVLVMRDEISKRISRNLGRLHDRDRPLLMVHAWNAFKENRSLNANQLDGLGAKTPGVVFPAIL